MRSPAWVSDLFPFYPGPLPAGFVLHPVQAVKSTCGKFKVLLWIFRTSVYFFCSESVIMRTKSWLGEIIDKRWCGC